MVASVLRVAALVLFLLGMAIDVTLAQGQPQPSPQQRVPAPDRHPATGLTFPPQIAGATQVRLDRLRQDRRQTRAWLWLELPHRRSAHRHGLCLRSVHQVDPRRSVESCRPAAIPDVAAGNLPAREIQSLRGHQDGERADRLHVRQHRLPLHHPLGAPQRRQEADLLGADADRLPQQLPEAAPRSGWKALPPASRWSTVSRRTLVGAMTR